MLLLLLYILLCIRRYMGIEHTHILYFDLKDKTNVRNIFSLRFNHKHCLILILSQDIILSSLAVILYLCCEFYVLLLCQSFRHMTVASLRLKPFRGCFIYESRWCSLLRRLSYTEILSVCFIPVCGWIFRHTNECECGFE